MLTTGRLLPMRVDEIPKNATWKHCAAYCQLERETIDFTENQLKAIGAYCQLEQQQKRKSNLISQVKLNPISKEVYGSNPQQFIIPGYFNPKLVKNYLQRKQFKKINRIKIQQENRQKLIKNLKKSNFEIFSELKVLQTNRFKEVMERQSNYISQVLQDKDQMTPELEIIVLTSFYSNDHVQNSVPEFKGITPFLMDVYWMGCRLLRALLP